MLKFDQVTVPASCLSYLAFRIALRDLLERIQLHQQFELPADDIVGYLAEVPFLKQVAPQVQVDLLADTWSRHVSPAEHPVTLLDEAVLYAVCETAARIVTDDAHAVPLHLRQGPLDVTFPVDAALADEIRNLYLKLPTQGEFLMVSQFLDIAPDEAKPLKRKFGMPNKRIQPLFEALGRWNITPDLRGRLRGLLSSEELNRVNLLLRSESKIG